MEERPLPPLVPLDGDLTPPILRRSLSEEEEFLTVLEDRINRHRPISHSSAMARRSLSSLIAKPSSTMGGRGAGGMRARSSTPSFDSSGSNSPSRPGTPDLERPVLKVEPLPTLPMASMREIAEQIRSHAAEALCALKHHGRSEPPSPPPLAAGLIDEPGLDVSNLNGRSVWRLQPHNTIKV